MYNVVPQDKGFAVHSGDTPLSTPGKQPLVLPARALAEAIAGELGQGKYSPTKMPLATLAYTAIDRIAAQPENIVEALLVYIDTDTLSYRATGSETLALAQTKEWDPVLAWAKKTYGATWQVTTGVMPLEQSEALHKAVAKKLTAWDAMQLAAACVLASGFSSLALMLAVMEKHLTAEEAFRLSRLEEESQAEQWGRDVEADIRTARLRDEIMAVKQFLGLLEAP